MGAHEARAAGGAYVVDTADVSEPGACKVESWASFADNRDFIAATTPTCVVNLFRPVEVSGQFVRSRSDGDWGTSLTSKFKTNIIPTAIGSWGVALAGGTSHDLITGAFTGAYAYVPVTFRFSNILRINLNGGVQYDRMAQRNYFIYGAGLDLRTPDNVWTLTGEIFGLAGTAADQGTVQPRFQLGLRWRPVDQFNIDVIYGRNLTGENANWITIATTFRFPVIGGK